MSAGVKKRRKKRGGRQPAKIISQRKIMAKRRRKQWRNHSGNGNNGIMASCQRQLENEMAWRNNGESQAISGNGESIEKRPSASGVWQSASGGSAIKRRRHQKPAWQRRWRHRRQPGAVAAKWHGVSASRCFNGAEAGSGNNKTSKQRNGSESGENMAKGKNSGVRRNNNSISIVKRRKRKGSI